MVYPKIVPRCDARGCLAMLLHYRYTVLQYLIGLCAVDRSRCAFGCQKLCPNSCIGSKNMLVFLDACKKIVLIVVPTK